jgi:hypothetical protein
VSSRLNAHLPWQVSNGAKDAWGYRIGTGAAAIDTILLVATGPLTEEQIVPLVREYGLKERGAVGKHLWELKHRGLITRTPEGFVRTRSSAEILHRLDASDANYDGSDEVAPYRPDNVDRRTLVERQIAIRRGQQKFRNVLRERYGDQCLITGCRVLAVLEAAHINPYRGEHDHHVENGLLLRADIHTLFDLDLLGIEPDELTIELHPSIESEYAALAGKRLKCPNGTCPSREQLEIRYESFRQRMTQAQ